MKYFAISNKICDMKTTEILNFEYKKLPSAKSILGDFCFFCFSIVLLAAQLNRKIESDIEFSGRRDQVTLRVYSRNKGYICVEMMVRHLVFVWVSLVFFSFKCYIV